MTAQEIQRRNERAQTLRVIQVSEGTFYVESSEGKICYKVVIDSTSVDCTCGDFARNIKLDPTFKCKHIAAVEGCVPSGQFETAQFLDRRKPKLDERFIMSIEGSEFVKYAGLLDLGHQKGILRVEVEVLQIPSEENKNTAICKATVVSKTGETFIDVGDASPMNTNSRVSKHLLRLASTRAIARSLRTFTNIGMTCLEELADFADAVGTGPFNRTENREQSEKGARPRKPVSRIPKEKPAQAGPVVKEQSAGPGNGRETPKGTENPSGSNGGKPEKKDPPAQTQSKTPGQPLRPDEESELNQPDRATQPKMSEAQRRAVYNLSRRRGISVEELERMTQERYHSPLENLSSKEASEFIRSLQQAA